MSHAASSVLSLLCVLTLAASLWAGPPPAGRLVVVDPVASMAPGEGVALVFEDGGGVLAGDRRPDGSYAITVPRRLLGTPMTVRRTPSGAAACGIRGQGIPPRPVAPFDEPMWIFPSAWSDRIPGEGATSETGSYGDYVFRDSPRLPGPRTVRIHLPASYEKDQGRRFPLVVALDGQNCVDGATSFGGVEWSLDETLARLERDEGLAAILVTVDNGGAARMDEYTFCPDPAEAGGAGGGAARHLEFLLQEVLPLIRDNFRVAPEAPVLVGSSLGGLFGLWTALTHPGAFAGVAAMSPSVWWADRAILSVPLAPGPLPRVWVDVGTDEAETAVPNAGDACERLRTLGWSDRDVRCTVVEGGAHREIDWADRVASALRFLLRDER